jgi:hypothetical protein
MGEPGESELFEKVTRTIELLDRLSAKHKECQQLEIELCEAHYKRLAAADQVYRTYIRQQCKSVDEANTVEAREHPYLLGLIQKYSAHIEKCKAKLKDENEAIDRMRDTE